MSIFGDYSAYYNLLYKDKNYAQEVDYVLGLIHDFNPDAKRILSLGTGTGNHDLLFAEKGLDVIGVDLSGEMLDVARKIAEEKNIKNIDFIQGDVRTVEIEGKFDVVISLFHVMSYQTGNADFSAAMNTAKKHLKPGGIFIFDVWYGPAVLTDRPALRVKRLEDDNNLVIRIASPEIFPEENMVNVNYKVSIVNKNGNKLQELEENHKMRYYFSPEITCFMEGSGFENLYSAEWMTGRTPDFTTWGVVFIGKA